MSVNFKIILCIFFTYLFVNLNASPISKNNQELYDVPTKSLNNQHQALMSSNQSLDSLYRITGGYRPSEHVVSIRRKNRFNAMLNKYFGSGHMCGGAILNSRVILTAAHCLKSVFKKDERPSSLEVVAKTPKRLNKTPVTQVLTVSEVITHSEYSPKTNHNDIGILKLMEDIIFDNKWADKIAQPNKPPIAETSCTVLGWGKMYERGPMPNEVLYINVVIHKNSYCHLVFPDLSEKQICAGDAKHEQRDACMGDSGSPLICDDVVVGIVSFGHGCHQKHPTVYSDVFYYLDWIKENHGVTSYGSCSVIFFIFAMLSIFFL
ncbi:chymotrypsin-2-like [Musca domestica]|uniref:Chymotrypsin-2-like n=2 Tax=Musca domestica TaxID=7370 RepID=A0A9J7CXJ7_MUSDO|nr:chymotrypsin-2-like [Musca domestica]